MGSACASQMWPGSAVQAASDRVCLDPGRRSHLHRHVERVRRLFSGCQLRSPSGRPRRWRVALAVDGHWVEQHRRLHRSRGPQYPSRRLNRASAILPAADPTDHQLPAERSGNRARGSTTPAIGHCLLERSWKHVSPRRDTSQTLEPTRPNHGGHSPCENKTGFPPRDLTAGMVRVKRYLHLDPLQN